MLNAPEPKTGPPAPVAPVEVPLKEGVGQQEEDGMGVTSGGDDNAVSVGDTPP